MSSRANPAAAVRWALAGNVLQRGLSFAGTLVICRLVAEEEFGAYRQVVAVHLLVATLMPWGFDQLVVREAGFRRRYLLTLAATVMFAGCLASCILFATQRPLAMALGLEAFRPALAVLPLSVLLQVPKVALKPYFLGRLEVRTVATGESLNNLVTWILVIPFLLWQPTALMLTVAYAGGELAESLCLMVARGRAALRWKARFHTLSTLWRRHARFSSLYTADQALGTFSLNAPFLLLGALISQKAVGSFSVAYMLVAGPLFLVASAIGRTVLPALAGRTHADMTRLALSVIRTTAALLPPALVVIAAFAPELAAVAIGRRWSPDVGLIVRLLTPYLCLAAVLSPVSGLDILMDRPEVSLIWNTTTAAVRCAALVVAAPHGLAAAMVAYSVASVVMVLLLGVTLARIIGCPPLEFNAQWLRFVPVWVAGAVLCWGLRLAGLPPLGGLAVAAVVLFGYYYFVVRSDSVIAAIVSRVMNVRRSAA